MSDKEPFNQQGDPFIFHTLEGGEVTAEEGLLQMTGGLPTAVYLSLFGGNMDDDGRKSNPATWWANAIELDPAAQYRSETQHALESLPAITASLRKVEAAAVRDLNWLITNRVASAVTVAATMPALNRIKLVVTIEAEGDEKRFEFVECWREGGFEPVVTDLSPEWRTLENYYPRLTEDGHPRLIEAPVDARGLISDMPELVLPVRSEDYVEVSRPRPSERDRFDSYRTPLSDIMPVQTSTNVHGIGEFATRPEAIAGESEELAISADALGAALADLMQNRIVSLSSGLTLTYDPNARTLRFDAEAIAPPGDVEFQITGQSSGTTGAFLANILGLNPSGATARGWSSTILSGSITPDPVPVLDSSLVAYCLLEVDQFPDPNGFYLAVFIAGERAQDYIQSVIDPDGGELVTSFPDIYGINDGSVETAFDFPSTFWAWGIGLEDSVPTWLGDDPLNVTIVVPT